MTRGPKIRNWNRRAARAIYGVLGASLSAVAVARIAVVSVAVPGCGGCLDASRVERFTVEPARPCLAIGVTGLCYGAGLAGTNGCAEPLMIATVDGPATVAPGASFDLQPAWTVTTESDVLGSTSHYAIAATLGTVPIAITFDY